MLNTKSEVNCEATIQDVYCPRNNQLKKYVLEISGLRYQLHRFQYLSVLNLMQSHF
jgi:hypothetical protein